MRWLHDSVILSVSSRSPHSPRTEDKAENSRRWTHCGPTSGLGACPVPCGLEQFVHIRMETIGRDQDQDYVEPLDEERPHFLS